MTAAGANSGTETRPGKKRKRTRCEVEKSRSEEPRGLEKREEKWNVAAEVRTCKWEIP